MWSWREHVIEAAKKAGLTNAAVPGHGSVLRTGQDSGLLILSRFPIDKTSIAWHTFSCYTFSEGLNCKGALLASILLPSGERLDACTAHLDSKTSFARTGQLQELYQFVKSHSISRHAVLGGDLNLTAGSWEYTYLRELFSSMLDPFAPNHPATFLDFTLDYLLTSEALRACVKEKRVETFGHARKQVSDHWGLSLSLQL